LGLEKLPKIIIISHDAKLSFRKKWPLFYEIVFLADNSPTKGMQTI
jgi:hypothetical protein